MADRNLYSGDPATWTDHELAAWVRRYASPDGPDQADEEAPLILQAAADRMEPTLGEWTKLRYRQRLMKWQADLTMLGLRALDEARRTAESGDPHMAATQAMLAATHLAGAGGMRTAEAELDTDGR